MSHAHPASHIQPSSIPLHQESINGCQLICQPITGFHSAAVGVWIRNGVRYEAEQQSGYAHFLEHLLFRRTKLHTGKQLSALFESMGGQVNAETGRELTAFHGHVPASHATTLLELLLEMLLQPAFTGNEFNKERDVVLQELAMLNDDPEEALEDYATECVWPGHSMGRQILGSRESLQEASLESLYQYIEQIIHPDNLLIVAVGAIDIEQIKQTCQSIQLNKRSGTAVIHPQFKKTEATLALDCEQTQLQWLMPAVAYADERAAAYQIANHILAGGYDSYLYQALREEQGLVYSIDSRIDYYSDTGLWFIQTNTEDEQADEVTRSTTDMITQLCQDGIKLEELDNARMHLKSSLILEADDIGSYMENLAREFIYHNQILSIEEKLASFDQVKLDEIQTIYQHCWPQAAHFHTVSE